MRSNELPSIQRIFFLQKYLEEESMDQLPTDILYQIALRTDYDDLPALWSTSRQLVGNDFFWRDKIYQDFKVEVTGTQLQTQYIKLAVDHNYPFKGVETYTRSLRKLLLLMYRANIEGKIDLGRKLIYKIDLLYENRSISKYLADNLFIISTVYTKVVHNQSIGKEKNENTQATAVGIILTGNESMMEMLGLTTEQRVTCKYIAEVITGNYQQLNTATINSLPENELSTLTLYAILFDNLTFLKIVIPLLDNLVLERHLYLATILGNSPTIELYLNAGITGTDIYAAIDYFNIDAIDILSSITTTDGLQILAFALRPNGEEMVEKLLRVYGPDLSEDDKLSLLNGAVQIDSPEIFQLICNWGINTDDLEQALAKAIKYNKVSFIPILEEALIQILAIKE